MLATNGKKPSGGREVKRIPARMPVRREAVLVSRMGERPLTPDERDEVSREISRKISLLEERLGDDGKGLCDELRSYIEAMTSGKRDELPPSTVVWESGTKKITIAPGEMGDKPAEGRVSSIIAGCMRVAKGDLEALKNMRGLLENTGSLSDFRRRQLIEILDGNSYMRHISLR